jgi:hypothetical protein
MQYLTALKTAVKNMLGIRPGPPKETLDTALPKVELGELFRRNEMDVRILEPITANGNVTINELFSLNYAVAATGPKSVFEIGTFDGRTTLNFAANSSEDTRIFTLDLPASGLGNTKYDLEQYDKLYVDKPQSGARFLNRPEQKKITQLFGDSATFDFSPYYNRADFIFVDGSHAYEYALNDSLIAAKLLRSNKGTILWHDYGHVCWPGVVKALEEIQVRNPFFKNLRHIKGTTLVCLVLE